MSIKLKPAMPESCKSCGGKFSDLRRRILGNEAVQIVYQCMVCGRSASNPLKQSDVKNASSLPLWDESRAARYDQLREAQKEINRTAWFQEHDAYLKTQKWKSKRALVIKRCEGVCEGCGEAQVSQVHHLTYDHWQDELLWELVGVCDKCHERAHKRQAP